MVSSMERDRVNKKCQNSNAKSNPKSKVGKSLKLFALLICVLIIIGVYFTVTQEKISENRFPPKWEIGLWWITESHVMENISEFDSGPEQLDDRIYYHKWIVAATKDHKGQKCWVVDIYPHKIPDGIKNDHGDEHLFRLYLAQSDFSLRRFEGNFRSRRYLVTGKLNSYVIEFTRRANPIVVTWAPCRCPLDIPFLPSYWFEQGLPEEDIEMVSIDQRSNMKTTQRIETSLSGSNNHTVPTVLIKLRFGDGDVRAQTWVPSCPWWSEWRCQYKNEKRDGLWYSKTIDWKGKIK